MNMINKSFQIIRRMIALIKYSKYNLTHFYCLQNLKYSNFNAILCNCTMIPQINLFDLIIKIQKNIDSAKI